MRRVQNRYNLKLLLSRPKPGFPFPRGFEVSFPAPSFLEFESVLTAHKTPTPCRHSSVGRPAHRVSINFKLYTLPTVPSPLPLLSLAPSCDGIPANPTLRGDAHGRLGRLSKRVSSVLTSPQLV
ncbi:hypothetical protein CRG98_003661 [Punica granatum]|uniref:Uncharacterized protein n=1 Tax=Punica granatum TaxID=22663 RepID=A0A2I0L5D6_PUNGR|nr:hypothetical protein CRG98_003661 [Punica granatum]